MVDVDTQAQEKFSEIWGWRIRVGDWFSGTFTPVPVQQVWYKMHPAIGKGYAKGAMFTSVLTDIEWTKKPNKLVKEFLEHGKPDKLSIHFNLDLFSRDTTWGNFSWGRITGAIGVSGKKAPPFFVGGGRTMRSRHKNVQNVPFVVDNLHNRYVQHTF